MFNYSPQHLVRASSLSASVIVCGLEEVTVKCKMSAQNHHHGGEGWDCRADPGMGQDLCSWFIRVCCCSSCGAFGQSLTDSPCSLPGARCGDSARLGACHHVWHSPGEPPCHPHLPRHRPQPWVLSSLTSTASSLTSTASSFTSTARNRAGKAAGLRKPFPGPCLFVCTQMHTNKVHT